MNALKPVDLFFKYFDYITRYDPDTDTKLMLDFCREQWPIVERALLGGEGIQACDSRAHDATCSFVERNLFNLYDRN
jgi:hypothetical protein